MARTLHCGDVYKEDIFNEILIKGLDKFVRQNIKGKWSTQKAANLPGLAFHATRFPKLQEKYKEIPSNNTTSNRNLIGRAIWQKQGTLENLNRSNKLRTTFIKQDSSV